MLNFHINGQKHFYGTYKYYINVDTNIKIFYNLKIYKNINFYKHITNINSIMVGPILEYNHLKIHEHYYIVTIVSQLNG